MHETRSVHATPGNTLMIVLIACLVGWAMWSATQRRMLVDDALMSGSGHGSERLNWPDMRIDINSANAGELAGLPGLGERLAQRIVEDRNRNGVFAKVDDLERVSGLGPVIIERLKPYAVAE